MTAIVAGPMAVSAIAQAVSALYGVTAGVATAAFQGVVVLNQFFDNHIEEMKTHENTTIARSGRVLDAAKYGFGIGYVTSVAVIATGQVILGNTLAAGGTFATALVLANPIAATCAAMGAVIYGYSALSDVEREELLAKISSGLAIGMELVKSIIRFVVDTAKALLSKENIAELKKFIATAAETFNRTLSDVTRKVKDRIADGLDVIKDKSGDAAEVISDGFETLAENAGDAFDKVSERVSKLKAPKKKAASKPALRKPSTGKTDSYDVAAVGTLLKKKQRGPVRSN
jgi:hypothetical protein